MRALDLFPETKIRKPRVIRAHIIDAGNSHDPDHPYTAQFECKKCSWESRWLVFRTATEIKKGIPCESCNKQVMENEMTKTRRIQLSRKAGFKLPPNTVSVARPHKWGNPFKIGEYGPLMRKPDCNASAVSFFRQMLFDDEFRKSSNYPSIKEIKSELAGKNLACWCSLDQPCHADVLLEIANQHESLKNEA